MIAPYRAALLAAALLFARDLAAAEAVTQLPGMVRELVTVTATPHNGAPVNLEAMVTRPAAPGRYPVIVLSHGAPRDGAERVTFSPANSSAVAIEFARRGWAVLSLVRRGYGHSDGPFAEGPGPCDHPHYVAAGRKSAEDVRAGMTFMAQQSYVEPGRVMLAGISAGGFASLSTAAETVPGIVAVLSFAGGRGSDAPDSVCSPDALVDAFGELGRTVRVPSLWFYSQNDHYMSPVLAQRFYDRFTASGGAATLVKLPAFGDDGHHLFSSTGMSLWRDRVDAFLREHALPTWPQRVVEPPARLPPPPLSAHGREEFDRYLGSIAFEKAFAVSASHHFGAASNRRSAAEAAHDALAECAKNAGDCQVYAVNNALAR